MSIILSFLAWWINDVDRTKISDWNYDYLVSTPGRYSVCATGLFTDGPRDDCTVFDYAQVGGYRMNIRAYAVYYWKVNRVDASKTEISY